jgi:glycosyltransferase involved in cell wall biosynthesis
MGRFRAGRFLVRQFLKRNTEYLKRTSSGKDLVIYCDYTRFEWPGAGGFGGSEEAAINLARALSGIGWDVTVYNNCGHKPRQDGFVTYRPFWEFNPRDRQDVVILWRWPKPLDWNINAERIFIDVHDIVPEDMLIVRQRLSKVSRIFVKSQFHRSLFPHVPDDKLAVVPNGIDLTLLAADEPKDPHLLVNTSSADRSMNVLPKLFLDIKRRVPQARLQWAYGWDVFELGNAGRPARMQWMEQTQRAIAAAGIESRGRLSQAEVGKLYQRGAILAYPTDFPEIDCISVRKAQACGCVPVTTDFAALAESVQFGIKVPTPAGDAWKYRDGFPYGIQDESAQRAWVDATVDLLTNPDKRTQLATAGAAWARQFAWPRIAARWDEFLKS